MVLPHSTANGVYDARGLCQRGQVILSAWPGRPPALSWARADCSARPPVQPVAGHPAPDPCANAKTVYASCHRRRDAAPHVPARRRRSLLHYLPV